MPPQRAGKWFSVNDWKFFFCVSSIQPYIPGNFVQGRRVRRLCIRSGGIGARRSRLLLHWRVWQNGESTSGSARSHGLFHFAPSNISLLYFNKFHRWIYVKKRRRFKLLHYMLPDHITFLSKPNVLLYIKPTFYRSRVHNYGVYLESHEKR